jgi:hypothetical protein
MNNPEQNEPPQGSAGDIAHAAGRALAGAIPFAGAGAIEVFNKVVTPPIEKRLHKWRVDIGERLTRLEEQGLADCNELPDSDEFVTMTMQATQIALRNHDREKLDALRNAVINTAMGNAPDDFYQRTFLHYIDILTPLHVKFIRLFRDPRQWFVDADIDAPQFAITSSKMQLIRAAFPDIARQEGLIRLVANDLKNRGLAMTADLNTMMTGDAAWNKLSSGLGDSFLDYITDPIPDANDG